MGLISFETLFQTLLLTNFLSIAKGWGIVRFYILREEATHVTIALGTVYLHYSAFFVTIELPTMNKIVRVRNSVQNTFPIVLYCIATLRRYIWGGQVLP
jgi:hypothetical protein